MSLEIKLNSVENSEDIEIIVSGEIDIDSSIKFKDELNAYVDECDGNVFINFENVSYIDSVGLGILLGIMKKVKGKNHNMILLKPQKNVIKLLEITGLNKIIKIQ